MKKIGFLIINYNDYKTTEKLINNIKDYKLIDEIVVVDNNSTDDSQKSLKLNKNITLINSKKNVGFASAINIGSKYLIDKYKECYIFISNSDIAISSEEDLKELINTFKIKNIALVGPVLEEPSGISRGWKLTSVKKDILLNIPFINRLYNKKLLNYKEEHYNTHLSYVDVVKGCIFLIDGNVLKKINYLDENTFLYYEENILAKKIKQINLKSVINNKVTIKHEHSVTINKNVNNVNKYKILKDSMMYFEKNYNNASKLDIIVLNFLNNLNLFFKKIRKR